MHGFSNYKGTLPLNTHSSFKQGCNIPLLVPTLHFSSSSTQLQAGTAGILLSELLNDDPIAETDERGVTDRSRAFAPE
jgi:hypothetical protein